MYEGRPLPTKADKKVILARKHEANHVWRQENLILNFLATLHMKEIKRCEYKQKEQILYTLHQLRNLSHASILFKHPL